MSAAELAACPFCGSTARVLYGMSQPLFVVRCDGCTIKFRHPSELATEDELIYAWNRRAPQPASDPLAECAERMLRRIDDVALQSRWRVKITGNEFTIVAVVMDADGRQARHVQYSDGEVATFSVAWIREFAVRIDPAVTSPPGDDYDRSIHSNPSAEAWAKFFCETVKRRGLGLGDLDEGTMIGWFANAMMAMHDHHKNHKSASAASPETAPDLVDLRAAGWSVAAHNDYRLNGKPMTFWLLTHPSGRWIKGEGTTDAEALAEAYRAIPATVPEVAPNLSRRCNWVRRPSRTRGPDTMKRPIFILEFRLMSTADADTGEAEAAARRIANMLDVEVRWPNGYGGHYCVSPGTPPTPEPTTKETPAVQPGEPKE